MTWDGINLFDFFGKTKQNARAVLCYSGFFHGNTKKGGSFEFEFVPDWLPICFKKKFFFFLFFGCTVRMGLRMGLTQNCHRVLFFFPKKSKRLIPSHVTKFPSNNYFFRISKNYLGASQLIWIWISLTNWQRLLSTH